MRGIVQKPLLGAESMGDGTSLAERDVAGRWLMKEGTGNKILDLSGNQNTGTLVADTHWIPGKFGCCLNFDGTGDYVGTGTLSYASNKDWTWSGWLKIDDKPGGNTDYPIAGGQGDTAHAGWSAGGIGVFSGGVWTLVQCEVYDGGYKRAQTPQGDDLSADTWYHAAGVLRGSNIEIWLNGVLKASTAVTLGGISFSPTYSFIGKHGNGFMKGDIDNVLIYNRASTAAEIRQQLQTPFIEAPGQTELLYVAPVGLSIPIAMHHYKQMAGAA